MHKSYGITATILALSATFATLGCAKHAAAPADSSVASAPAATPATNVVPTDITPVRGALANVSDTLLVVTTSTGDVRVLIDGPLHVFQRANSVLSKVSAKSFVGVTAVKQADGSELATEIHIFPEELRGTGEGSYLMTPPPGAHDSIRSTMTNGTVKAANANEAPRMTNGAVASKNGETLIVDYHGGSQRIKVPSDVKVTALEPSSAKLSAGAKVVVLAKKQPDGTMEASSLVLAAEPAK